MVKENSVLSVHSNIEKEKEFEKEKEKINENGTMSFISLNLSEECESLIGPNKNAN